MAILKPTTLPSPAATAFSTGLSRFLAVSQDNINQKFAGAAPRIPTLSDLGMEADRILPQIAQPIFVLDLNAAANSADASEATPAGWRFFAGNSQENTVFARVSPPRSESGWKLTATYYGERAWDAFNASEALNSLPEVREADYELRVLAVPGLNLEAFWLVAKSQGRNDLVVPFPAPPNQPIGALNRAPVYTMANFLAAIRPLVIVQLQTRLRHGN